LNGKARLSGHEVRIAQTPKKENAKARSTAILAVGPAGILPSE
jgi:hypothetical protein